MAKWPYNTQHWKRLRLLQLGKQPLCVMCESMGRLTAATQVDHIVPIKDGGDPWAMENLQSLCASCHSHKTSTEDGGFGNERSGKKTMKGCGKDGMPLDGRHWWND
jgi:5-methylcytosine-specific restriction protein A